MAVWSVGWNGKHEKPRTFHQVTTADLDEILSHLDPDGDAEFNLFRDASDVPMLTLAVTDDQWYLHFLPDDEGPGFHSLAPGVTAHVTSSPDPAPALLAAPRPYGDFVMVAGLDDPANEPRMTWLPASDSWVVTYSLVSGDVARSAAAEVMDTMRLPTCLEWFEL